MARVQPAPLNGETIVAANVFLGHMADRYLHHVPTAQPITAMGFALPAFDALIERVTFGDRAFAWDQDHAIRVVDTDVSQWEGGKWPTLDI